jgi:hypothetical protein
MKSKVAQRMESKIPEETKVFVDNYAKELVESNRDKFMKLVTGNRSTEAAKKAKFRRKFRLLLRLKSNLILLWLWLIEKEAKTNLVSFFNKPKWEVQIDRLTKSYWKPYFSKSYSLKEPVWEDRDNGSPRVYSSPYVEIRFLWWLFYFYRGYDEYWERYLWIHNYNEGNEIRAIENYSWRTHIKDKEFETTFRTWFNVYEEKCPHCKVGTLDIVRGIYPYNIDFKQCNKCDSTFNI